MKQQQTGFDTQFDCEIRFKNHLDDHWLVWFEGMVVKHLADGEVQVAGIVPDQAALFGLLNRVRDLNLKVISLNVNMLRAQSVM